MPANSEDERLPYIPDSYRGVESVFAFIVCVSGQSGVIVNYRDEFMNFHDVFFVFSSLNC